MTPSNASVAVSLLPRLLDADLAFSPSIQRVFSSHLAMSLVALEHLGAPSAVLQATYDAHASSGEAEPRADVDDLAERVAEVERDGIAATVRARVPALVDAPATALFHPMIRLGYALDVGHAGQVAAALLDWERRREPTPHVAGRPGPRRLADVAADLAARPAGTWTPTYDLDRVARQPALAAALDGLALDEHTLDDISGFALAAHVAADHFVTLHLLTGARALRAVAAHVDAPTAAALVDHTAPMMAIAYAATGAPPLHSADEMDALRRSPLPSSAELAERATAATDPHVVKLTETALSEEHRTTDPLYRLLATRALHLAP